MSTQPPKKPNKVRNAQYPIEIWWCLSCVLAIIIVCRIVNSFILWQRRRSQQIRPSLSGRRASSEKFDASESISSGVDGKVSIRRLPIAVVNAYRIVANRTTIPIGSGHVLSLTDLFLTVAYIAILFIWTLINARAPGTSAPIAYSYYSDRAGDIVTTQLPLVTALGTRNNIISWLTGISYEKLNLMHRVTARVCLILIWLHGMSRLPLDGVVIFQRIDVHVSLSAAILWTLLILLSIRPVRSKSYEIFYIVHFITVILVLCGGYHHVMAEGGNGYYFYPSFIIWGLDRVLRVVRIVVFNFFMHTKNTLEAQVDIIPDSSMIRVTAYRKVSWSAGQHFYMIMPGVAKWPFESHPFTVASLDRKILDDEEAADNGKKMTFIIRSRGGFTKHLRQAAEKSGGSVRQKIVVDGPYGAPPVLTSSSTVILIGGGSGISYTIAMLQDLVYHARKKKSLCNRVLFLWALREEGLLSAVSPLLLAALKAVEDIDISLDVQLYMTQGPMPVDNGALARLGTKDSETKSSTAIGVSDTGSSVAALLSHPRVNMSSGRPILMQTLDEEISLAAGPVSVAVSGPNKLSSVVKDILQGDLAGPMGILKGRVSVTLHVASFEMA